MSTSERTYRTLRLLCANAAGMFGFLMAAFLGQGVAGALAVGVILGVLGYAASRIVVAYATA